MTIKELLVTSAPVTVQEDETLALALQAMLWGDLRHLPVMRGDRAVGVVSERDILRRYADVGRQTGRAEPVSNAMSSPPVCIGEDEDVTTALRLAADRGLGCLLVLDERKLVGIVTRRDLLRAQLERRSPEAAAAPTGPGSRLVEDVMTRDPVTASADDSLLAAMDRMSRHNIRHLPVVDGERRVVGIVSDRDLRTAIGNPMRALDPREAKVRIEATRVAQMMSRTPLTLTAGASLNTATGLFADHKIGAAPVVDRDERLIGIVSYVDILRAMLIAP